VRARGQEHPVLFYPRYLPSFGGTLQTTLLASICLALYNGIADICLLIQGFMSGDRRGDVQGVIAGGVRLARMVMDWQAAVRFSTDFLCVSGCLLGSSPALSATWFALQTAKF